MLLCHSQSACSAPNASAWWSGVFGGALERLGTSTAATCPTLRAEQGTSLHGTISRLALTAPECAVAALHSVAHDSWTAVSQGADSSQRECSQASLAAAVRLMGTAAPQLVDARHQDMPDPASALELQLHETQRLRRAEYATHVSSRSRCNATSSIHDVQGGAALREITRRMSAIPECAMLSTYIKASDFDYFVATAACSIPACAAVVQSVAAEWEAHILQLGPGACLEDMSQLSFANNLCMVDGGGNLCAASSLGMELAYTIQTDYVAQGLILPSENRTSSSELQESVSSTANVALTPDLLNLMCESQCFSQVMEGLFRLHASLQRVDGMFATKMQAMSAACQRSPNMLAAQFCLVEQDNMFRIMAADSVATSLDPAPTTDRILQPPRPESLPFELLGGTSTMTSFMCSQCSRSRAASAMSALHLAFGWDRWRMAAWLDASAQRLRLLQQLQPATAPSSAAGRATRMAWGMFLDMQLTVMLYISWHARMWGLARAVSTLDDLACDARFGPQRVRCQFTWEALASLQTKRFPWASSGFPLPCWDEAAGLAGCVGDVAGRMLATSTCTDCCNDHTAIWLAHMDASFLEAGRVYAPHGRRLCALHAESEQMRGSIPAEAQQALATLGSFCTEMELLAVLAEQGADGNWTNPRLGREGASSADQCSGEAHVAACSAPTEQVLPLRLVNLSPAQLQGMGQRGLEELPRSLLNDLAACTGLPNEYLSLRLAIIESDVLAMLTLRTLSDAGQAVYMNWLQASISHCSEALHATHATVVAAEPRQFSMRMDAKSRVRLARVPAQREVGKNSANMESEQVFLAVGLSAGAVALVSAAAFWLYKRRRWKVLNLP